MMEKERLALISSYRGPPIELSHTKACALKSQTKTNDFSMGYLLKMISVQ